MGALANLRVLDLTQILAGPYCTMMLADMGADVVKIERPGGERIRSNPPFVADPDTEAFGGYFQSVNRGKRSLELDLRDETDRDHFLSLVETADVLVENFKSGTMERLDLGYETLTEYNPQLIYSTIRGFGDPRTGATDRQGQPSYDLIAQALGGVMEITGQEDGPPTKTGPGIGDLFTGTLNCIGILAALHHRDRTGEGQFVDTAMYDAMISLTERSIYQHSYTGTPPTRQGNAHPTLFPYNAFETADGYVVLAAFDTGHWRALCEAMDRPDLAADYPDRASRLANRESLGTDLAAWVGDQSTADVVEALEGTVPVAPVQSTADIVSDSHVHERDMLVSVEQPGADTTVEIAGSPIKMTKTPPEPGGRAPLRNEHRDDIIGNASKD